jgi:hypothetical protein
VKDRLAVRIEEITGAPYSICYRWLNGVRAGGGELVKGYLDRVLMLPANEWGSKDDPLCVICLKKLGDGPAQHRCGPDR